MTKVYVVMVETQAINLTRCFVLPTDEENTREQLKPEIIKALSVPDGTEDRQKVSLSPGLRDM